MAAPCWCPRIQTILDDIPVNEPTFEWPRRRLSDGRFGRLRHTRWAVAGPSAADRPHFQAGI